ncbi:hypothetical protein AB0D99_02860 [Streptomyces sp. NPDC047971]|uniref:hypothetical protein n=1 Tax=Streptomyces sp. NPDC047971 TaxID=3154499 RepID=UPI0033D58ED4
MDASTVVGVLVVAGGAALMATGVARKGRAIRPLRPARARAAAERADSRVLLRAAGMAIASARETAGHGEPAIVTVEDVMRLMADHVGRAEVPREQAAAALRLQYERAACARDCVTDAFT